MNPLKWLKYRLSHIPATSTRYKMVKFIWKQKRVEHAKACTFYWVMIPTSVLGLIGVGALLMLVIPIFTLVCVIARFFGYSCTFFQDKYNGDAFIRGDSLFYHNGYNPRKGSFRRYEPWQFFGGPLAIFLLHWLVTGGPGSTAVSATGATAGFIAEWWYVGLGILTFAGLSYLVGRAFARREINLKAKWEELCPPLVVEVTAQPEEVAA